MEEEWKPTEDYKTLKTQGGVYVFADESKDVKYIGKAPTGRMVVEIGNSINETKDRSATQVKVLYTDSYSNTETLSRKLRIKYNPVNN